MPGLLIRHIVQPLIEYQVQILSKQGISCTDVLAELGDVFFPNKRLTPCLFVLNDVANVV